MTYKTLLLNQLPASKKKIFDQKLKNVAGNILSKADQIHVNAEVINWLIKEVAPANSPQLNSINSFLHNKYGQLLAKDISTSNFKFSPPPSLSDALKRQGFDLSVAVPKTNLSGQAYINECRAQGVPVPPDWGSNLWVSRGTLDKKFIVKLNEAEVFTYESTTPRGICVALPRYPAGSATVGAFALGIICQGNDSNKACFWDSAEYANIPLSGNVTPIVSPSFNGGAALYGKGGGVCSDCHAGQNAFVVHPGSPLALGSGLKARGWVKPLVHPGWPQNPGPTTVLNNITLNTGVNTD